MTQFLAGKRILLGVTGSIAAYKSPDLVRRLREAGATVRVTMTENAKRFITPLTMQAVSGFPVHEELFDLQAEAAMGHIELARWADLILIAPATADFMARFAKGLADDLLTTLCIAAKAPVMIAPAMNQGMWKHAMTQENLQILEQHKHVHVVGPTDGNQACGDTGPGRMLEPADIVEKASQVFATGLLAGLKVLVTAGPTHEPIDPVRFITNGSSGKMGFAIAEAAREAGADVTLISGPVSINKPNHLKQESVITAQEMFNAVMSKIQETDIFFGVAAVSDYRTEIIAPQKIHKSDDKEQLVLIRNPDIIATVAELPIKPFIVGFAAETENVLKQAKEKRTLKKMDLIIANRVGGELGMGSDENEVTIIGDKLEVTLPATTKRKLARQIVAMVSQAFNKRIL